MTLKSKIRKNCKDIWNAFMVYDAIYTKQDIPIFKSTQIIPKQLIAFDDAKHLVKNDKSKYYPDLFVHFYIDDQKFDGKFNSIWLNPKETLIILKHFGGVISPDFSTYVDFPFPIILYNIYRSQAFSYWLTQNGINVIQNARWGYSDTWDYFFNCIPKYSNICIGTIGSSLKKLKSRTLFNEGILELVKRIQPKKIIVYGSANYPVFSQLNKMGINIIQFESKTNTAFKGGKNVKSN